MQKIEKIVDFATELLSRALLDIEMLLFLRILTASLLMQYEGKEQISRKSVIASMQGRLKYLGELWTHHQKS